MYVQTRSDSFRWQRFPSEIKFWITSSPTRGRANRELVKQIAKICKVATQNVRIVAGGKSRRKIIQIEGLDFQSVNDYFSRD